LASGGHDVTAQLLRVRHRVPLERTAGAFAVDAWIVSGGEGERFGRSARIGLVRVPV
jgi:hypothetical protein